MALTREYKALSLPATAPVPSATSWKATTLCVTLAQWSAAVVVEGRRVLTKVRTPGTGKAQSTCRGPRVPVPLLLPRAHSWASCDYGLCRSFQSST